MLRQIPINGFDNNFSYFVFGKDEHEVAIVDPGDVQHLVSEINEGMFDVKMILVTHSHHDHIEGVAALVEKYGVPVYVHENARDKLAVPEEYLVLVKDGDKIDIGGVEVVVMHTPGHIDDAVCYYIEPNQDRERVGRLITGDTLFVEGCGRADLKGSSVEDLYESLQRIKTLPPKTKIYPGHDYGSRKVSSLAWEKKHNRFLKCKNLEEFTKERLGGTLIL